jgi:5'-3' exonuclease
MIEEYQSGGGIKNFFNIKIDKQKRIKNLFVKVKLDQLKGKKISIDASNVLYQIISISHKTKKPELFDLILRKKLDLWKKNKIISIWVFDHPKSNPLRLDRKELDICEPTKGVSLTNSNILRAQEIFKEEGITYITSPFGYEAEQICAKLTRKKIKLRGKLTVPKVDFVMTCDSDALVFGAKGILVRTKSSRIYKFLSLTKLLKESKINRKQLAIIAVILGTDFNQGIKGIGAGKVISLVRNDTYPKLSKKQKKIVKYYLC